MDYLSKFSLVGPLFFSFFEQYKMNEIVNKFLIAGDEFIPEMHLRQAGFTYSACRPFTKNKEIMQKFKFGLSPSKKVVFISLTDSPSKIMKMLFISS